MFDQETKRIEQIAIHNSENAKTYRNYRVRAARCAYTLDIMVSKAYLDGTINQKASYEKAVLFVAGQSDINMAVYKDFLESTAEYKGLEKVIEANASQIMLAQSKMKFIGQGEKYG